MRRKMVALLLVALISLVLAAPASAGMSHRAGHGGHGSFHHGSGFHGSCCWSRGFGGGAFVGSPLWFPYYGYPFSPSPYPIPRMQGPPTCRLRPISREGRYT
jgi:hypothetical protein